MKEYSKNSSIDELMKTSLDKVKTLMETNTIVGEAIRIDDITSVIPISKASVGFVVGGGEYADKSTRRVANHFPMAGGSGCGMSVTPVGFIVIQQDEVKFVDIENKTTYQTILNLVNSIVDKLKSNNKEEKDEKK
ncbi:MAG: hypothetical protein E7376_00345 [Clostridiales bacterium]|nr:hypothetical protein [Clostridiales bacterium]